MQSGSCLNVRAKKNCALLAWALLALACVGVASGCDVGSKPEPPYKDPPPNQRIKSSQAPMAAAHLRNPCSASG